MSRTPLPRDLPPLAPLAPGSRDESIAQALEPIIRQLRGNTERCSIPYRQIIGGFGVSQQAASNACRLLEERGLLVIRRGAGIWISSRSPERKYRASLSSAST
ncbi:MAG: hypothetical protein WDO13_08095 [Verrucomicrobiota bacterium]